MAAAGILEAIHHDVDKLRAEMADKLKALQDQTDDLRERKG
jgi:hypothetical protein